jgi:hypothetical protein
LVAITILYKDERSLPQLSESQFSSGLGDSHQLSQLTYKAAWDGKNTLEIDG